MSKCPIKFNNKNIKTTSMVAFTLFWNGFREILELWLPIKFREHSAFAESRVMGIQKLYWKFFLQFLLVGKCCVSYCQTFVGTWKSLSLTDSVLTVSPRCYTTIMDWVSASVVDITSILVWQLTQTLSITCNWLTTCCTNCTRTSSQ